MNYSLNVKSSSIVHTLLSNCVKLLGKVQKLLIKCISYSVISKRIRVVSPKFYTVRKNFTGPPVPPVPTNLKSVLTFNIQKLSLVTRILFIKVQVSTCDCQCCANKEGMCISNLRGRSSFESFPQSFRLHGLVLLL